MARRPTPDVLIIGAGVIGMMTARELLRAGLEVAVIERGPAGREASRAAGGILSPLYPWRVDSAISRLALWSHRRYPELAAELAHESGIDPEWIRSGMLFLGCEEPDRACAWAAEQGLRCELLEGDAVRASDPAVAPEWSRAVLLPDIAQVRNPRLLEALIESLQRGGATLIEHVPALGLITSNGRVRGVETPNGMIEAGAVVLAAGAWSSGLLPPEGPELVTRPVRGQMIWYQTEPGAIRHILQHTARYVIPRRDGVCIVGSTREEVGFDSSVTEQAAEELRAAAYEMVPLLGECEVMGQWAGLRPATASGLPWIGPHPGLERLFLNTGHYRNGVTLAPASARLLADRILGREPVIEPAPYLPGAGDA